MKLYHLPRIQRIILFILIIFLILPYAIFGQKLPKPVGYVNDFANVIDAQTREEITRLITVIQRATGVEIAVATVPTIAPYGSIEEYSIDLASQWKIGKKGKDNGVLLVLAMKERKVRIEVGYGLEGIIPDGLAGEILDKSILPSLRSGRYGEGLYKGVQAISGIIAKAYNVDLRSYNLNVEESKRYTKKSGIPLGLIFLILIFLFGGGRFLFWPLIFLGGFGGRGFFGGGFGTGGDSGFGGGFSGFGGGGFGGGGASRGF